MRVIKNLLSYNSQNDFFSIIYNRNLNYIDITVNYLTISKCQFYISKQSYNDNQNKIDSRMRASLTSHP